MPKTPSGNRNLFKGSRDFSGTDWVNNANGVYAEDFQGVKIFKTQAMWSGRSQYFEVKTGEEYTFSAYVKSSAKADRAIFFLPPYSKQPKSEGLVGFESADSQDAVGFDLTDEYQRIAIKIKITKDDWIMPRLERGNNNAYLFFGGYKFERSSTATPYSQAPEDLDWSSTPQVPTQQQRYLWKFEYVYYSDGSVEVTQPVNLSIAGQNGATGPQGPKGDQGIPGPKGADGKTQYTHIAYADTVSGSGFSQTDINKAFIGMYQDFKATDSLNPQDYRWSKWKGSDGRDGIPGKPGTDGRTPYVHFAYADSADGRTGFSTTQNGNKRYLGVCTNFYKEDSTNPSDYTWNDTAGSVSVGGENLIRNSAFPENLDNWGYWEAPGSNPHLSISSHSFYYNGSKPIFLLKSTSLEGDSAATLRFPVKRNADYSINIQMFATENIRGVDFYFLGRKSNETTSYTKIVHPKRFYGSPSSTSVTKYHFTFNTGECDEGFIRVANMGTTNGSESLLFFTELDCYEGTTDRAWQSSPKDLASQLDGKADQVLTQSQLNRLNEINSVMKAELEAKASLDTLNQWVKAYQDFVTANNANRAQALKALADTSARVVKLENNLGDMAERWNFIDNYMSASNEGFIIGKKDNSSSIMFNPDGRISMFSAGNEVMYISKGVIHIENGIFSKTVQIGRFREEQDYLNPDRNVIRYVGGK